MKRFLMGMVLALAFTAPAQAQQGQWQNYFNDSQEKQSDFCANGIAGLRVQGTYAYNNSVFCRTTDIGIDGDDKAPFKAAISEELPNNTIECGPQEAIVGMKCSGTYCDNVAVQCGPVDPTRAKVATGNRCAWFGPISDSGQTEFVSDGIMTGLKCEGAYCYNKSLKFCQYDKPSAAVAETLRLEPRWESICSGEGECTASVSKSFVASNEAEKAISNSTTAALAVSVAASAEGILFNTSVSTEASIQSSREEVARILRSRSNGTDSGCQATVNPGPGIALVWRHVYEGTIQGYPVTLKTCKTTCTTTQAQPAYQNPGDPASIGACNTVATSATRSGETSTPKTVLFHAEVHLSLQEAIARAASLGGTLASPSDVDTAWRTMGLDVYAYGMMSDGSFAVPVQSDHSNFSKGANIGAVGGNQGFFYVKN